MANKITFTVASNYIPQVLEASTEMVRLALEKVGVQAVGHAVEEITAQGAIDTGLLRNSLTYALDGQAPKNTTYKAMYGSNKTSKGKRYSARSSKSGVVEEGSYSGAFPSEGNHRNAVYIGTNVYYAVYVEMGHRTVSGKTVPARPYLKPAIENNMEEYKQIINNTLHGR